MTWLMTAILKFLSGGALDRIFKYLETKQKIETDAELIKADLIKEAISAELRERELMIAQIREEHGWAVTRWLRPAFAYPLAIYYAAIIADSMFQFSFNIAALPSPMMEWSGVIITFYFGGRTIERVAQIMRKK